MGRLATAGTAALERNVKDTAIKIYNTVIIVIWFAVAAFVILALFTGARAADNVRCLTKAEARAKWPKAHLYWHGADHCWDNQAKRRQREPHIIPEPLVLAAMAKDQKPLPPMPSSPPRKQEIIYPALIASQAAIINDLMAIQKPITEWPLMIDIDASGPDPNNGIDACCWPPMEALK
jgi:hypothetical protein